ncbi:MAG: sulfatase, partial [Verrucomicrobiota bacterium]
YSVIREDSWKLIRFYESGREELYNLAADPSEQRDIASAEPARLRKLGKKLDAWLRETGAQLPVERQKAGKP